MTLADDALAVLRGNDTGRYVKPSQRLYPWQWNWDSAFIAIGLARVDPERARTEIRSLLEGQWADGMVPHIVFHPQRVDYWPGPEVWGSKSCAGAPEVATSGLTQPPVLATAVRVVHEAAPDTAFLDEVVPKLEAWHEWFQRDRAHLDTMRCQPLPQCRGEVLLEALDLEQHSAVERPALGRLVRALPVERAGVGCHLVAVPAGGAVLQRSSAGLHDRRLLLAM